MKDWLQTTRDSLERSVLPLVPDPAAREQVTGHFRSHLGWLDGLETRKLEMAFLKAHLDNSLVLPLKRELRADYSRSGRRRSGPRRKLPHWRS